MRTVDELIDQHNGSWDEQLIRDIFLPIDANNILAIPLSPHLQEDFVAWHKTKNFLFSVRSAYHIEWDHQFGARTRREDGQGSAEPNPVWDILWKLKIPSKIKVFLWKALHGTFPGMAILASRHIPVSPQCPICRSGPENIWHLLFTCTRARKVWSALGLLDIIDDALIADMSGSVVLEHIICNPNRKLPVLGMLGLQESVAVACWYVWWQRREAKGETVADSPWAAFAIQALTSNFGAVSHSSKPHQITCEKPSRGCYKLNTDAAFRQDGSGAVGVVIRNSVGEAVAGAESFSYGL